MNNYEKWLKSIATYVGLTEHEINTKEPEEIKKHIQNKTHKNISYKSAFPFIGRGNVLRDNIATTREINKDIDKILA